MSRSSRRALLCLPIAALAALSACAVSTQQEVAMGSDYAQQINAQLPIVRDAEVNRYINALGAEIAQRTGRSDLPWRFFVVNSPEVNAFAVPGGYIYVNRGLIERTSRMDELAGVMGHEIGHVVKRHSIDQMQKAQGANLGLAIGCGLTNACNSQAAGAAINVGGSALFAKFSRDDEDEADAEGVKNVVRAGISPRGMVTMFQKLVAERRTNPSRVDTWFASHPLEENRIAHVQQLIAGLSPGTLSRLQTDSRAFQTFRARVRSLPAGTVAAR
jgi:predicted Zn-dependent protease